MRITPTPWQGPACLTDSLTVAAVFKSRTLAVGTHIFGSASPWPAGSSHTLTSWRCPQAGGMFGSVGKAFGFGDQASPPVRPPDQGALLLHGMGAS